MPAPGVAPQLSALETARRIAAGETTAVAEVEAAIARIEATDKEINAVVVRVFDRARKEAKEADELVKQGIKKQLLGVPVTVKEQFNLKGTPMTWGFEQHKSWISDEDGYIITKLREAGAIVVGKTNVPVGLADWQSVNPIYGRTLNPWDKTRSPGGSSGGSSASLAAGYVPLEVGSDIGGSIRNPANFCGVVGHKPTYGLIPPENLPGSNEVGAVPPIFAIGPMARTTEDVAAALDILSERALPRSEITSLKSLKIFVQSKLPNVKTSKNVSSAIDEAAAKAEKAGAIIIRESPLLPNAEEYYLAYRELLWIIMSGGAHAKPDGSPFTAADYLDMLNRQAKVFKQWELFFKEFDCMMMPVYPVQAFPHVDSPEFPKRVLDVDGQEQSYEYGGFMGSGPATYGHLPSTAVPLGLKDGLPTGVQVICNKLRDHDAIKIAGLIMVPV